MDDVDILANEEKIVRQLSSLKYQVQNIESTSGRSPRTRLMRDEIVRLEALRAYANAMTNPIYDD